jgi:hypothetical protein
VIHDSFAMAALAILLLLFETLVNSLALPF